MSLWSWSIWLVCPRVVVVNALFKNSVSAVSLHLHRNVMLSLSEGKGSIVKPFRKIIKPLMRRAIRETSALQSIFQGTHSGSHNVTPSFLFLLTNVCVSGGGGYLRNGDVRTRPRVHVLHV